MAKEVMTMAKRRTADAYGLEREANRSADDVRRNPEKYSHIDAEKTNQNVFLVRTDDWAGAIRDHCKAMDKKPRKDAVTLVTTVYSASPEFFALKSRESIIAFFEDCLEHERSKGGTVINAVIHFDETTPHMQTASIPDIETTVYEREIVYKLNDDGTPQTDDSGKKIPERYPSGKIKYRNVTRPVLDDDGKPVLKKDGTPRLEPVELLDADGNVVKKRGLNAKAWFGNRVTMSRRQDEFHAKVGKKWGLERGECRVEDDSVKVRRETEAEMRASGIVKAAEERAAQIEAETANNGMIVALDALALEARESDLAKREETVLADEEAISKRAEELSTQENALARRKRKLDEREASIDAEIEKGIESATERQRAEIWEAIQQQAAAKREKEKYEKALSEIGSLDTKRAELASIRRKIDQANSEYNTSVLAKQFAQEQADKIANDAKKQADELIGAAKRQSSELGDPFTFIAKACETVARHLEDGGKSSRLVASAMRTVGNWFERHAQDEKWRRRVLGVRISDLSPSPTIPDAYFTQAEDSSRQRELQFGGSRHKDRQLSR